MNRLKRFHKYHQWFIANSKEYMRGIDPIRFWIKFPIAWIKFMWYSLEVDRMKTELRNTNKNNSSDS